MAKKIEVMNVELDNCSARETMILMEAFLDNSVLNTIEEVTRPMIVSATEDAEVKECIDSLDLAIPGDRGILAEAGLEGSALDRGMSFFYEFAKSVIRGGKKVLILGENAEAIKAAETFLAHGYEQMIVIGTCALEDFGDEAGAINEINIQMPDVVLSVLPTPVQEHFLLRQKERLHAKVWYGMSNETLMDHSSSKTRRTIRRFFRKMTFRRYMSAFEKSRTDPDL